MRSNNLLLILSILLAMSCGNSSKRFEKGKKPNIFFIVVDDLGYTDLSVMGSPYYETPNIDRLAKAGTIFTNGYATCAVCSPSRASLLNGQFTARHGITQYIGALSGQAWKDLNRHTKLLPPDYKRHLDLNDVTLPEVLKEHGYATFFAGKWHLGSEENGSLPTNHGFDVNQGGYEAGGPYSGGYFSPFNNPQMRDYPEEKGMSLSRKLAKETAAFIREKKDSPFFAYLSFYAVHAPIQTTQPKWKKYRDKADSLGIAEDGFEMERILPARKYQDNPVYAGLIEQVDEAVGHVLNTLEELDIQDNTIVVFTSDNGGVTSGDNYSTTQLNLRGGKGYQWEGGIRVPYFIYVPWLSKQVKQSEVPVSGADLFPTLLELVNIPLLPDEHADGVSLKSLLQGNTIGERALYWHYPHYGNQGGEPVSMMRKDKWKIIYYWEDGHTELYNLQVDTAESADLYHENEGLALAMKTELMNWLDSMKTDYAEPDTLWNEQAWKDRLSNHRTKLLSALEKERKEMLSPDWKPNKDWWGSME